MQILILSFSGKQAYLMLIRNIMFQIMWYIIIKRTIIPGNENIGMQNTCLNFVYSSQISA